jgi:hypothetical protein
MSKIGITVPGPNDRDWNPGDGCWDKVVGMVAVLTVLAVLVHGGRRSRKKVKT